MIVPGKKSLKQLQVIMKNHGLVTTNQEAERIAVRLLELALLAKRHRISEIYKNSKVINSRS